MATNVLIGYPDIPFRSTVELNGTAATNFDYTKLITGSRAEYFKLSAGTTDDQYFDYDSGSTDQANYFAIMRAKLLKRGGTVKVHLRQSSSSVFSPLSVSGLIGWYDSNRGITKDGSNLVSQWNDQSGNGNHATQPTGANQPTWVTPASGINGNAYITFGGTHTLKADAIGTALTGTDIPFSVLMVARRGVAAAGTYFGLGHNTTFGIYQIEARSTNFRFRKSDTGGTLVDQSGGTATLNTEVVSMVHSGTAVSAWVNGANIINAASQDVGATSLNNARIGGVNNGGGADVARYTGDIGELLVFDEAIGTSDRQMLEAYLTSKWSTSALYGTTALDFTALTGPQEDDLVSSFSLSSATRYFWVQLGALTTNKFQHSKQYFGTWFDMGRDPIYGAARSRKRKRRGGRAPAYSYTLTWKGVTDAKVNEFNETILLRRKENPVLLYDANNYVLDDFTSLHATILDPVVTPISYNNNTVTATFEELI